VDTFEAMSDDCRWARDGESHSLSRLELQDATTVRAALDLGTQQCEGARHRHGKRFSGRRRWSKGDAVKQIAAARTVPVDDHPRAMVSHVWNERLCRLRRVRH
jgi:hypothetical protein